MPWDASPRRLFVSKWYGEGGLLSQRDYGQLEVRVIAALSGEEKLMEIFRQNRDVHAELATTVYKVSLEHITGTSEGKAMRRFAKTVIFGVIYGRGARSIAASTPNTEEEAQDFIDTMYRSWPKFAEWVNSQHDFVHKHGHVITPMGRILPIPHGQSDDFGLRRRAERQSQNWPVQSGASDTTLMAVNRIQRELRSRRDEGMNSQLSSFIHDDIGADIAPGELLPVFKMVMRYMNDKTPGEIEWLDVPLVSDSKLGARWDGGCEAELVDEDTFHLTGPLPFYKELLDHLKIAYVVDDRVLEVKKSDSEALSSVSKSAYHGNTGDFKVEAEVRIRGSK